MSPALWYLLVGGVFLVMVGGVTVLQRLPLSTAMLYLLVGIGLGPVGLDVARLDVSSHGTLIEHASELVVLLSLLSVGLKLRMPFGDERWAMPVRLASLGMIVTIGVVAIAAHWIVGLPLAAALLLGAILAPTDPVLAADVQVAHAFDGDRLRLTLTGEAGLNDGAAMPFALLGLGLLGLHPLGPVGVRWLTVDVVYGTATGLAIGWFCGCAAGRFVLFLRRRYHESIGLDDFLALGLVAGVYGIATLAHAFGFLSVFAAGLALRSIERERSPGDVDADNPPDPSAIAVVPLPSPINSAEIDDDTLARHHPALDPERGAAFLAAAVLGFNTQLERIAEVAMVGAIGVMLSTAIHASDGGWRAWWPSVGLAAVLLFVARPLAAQLCLIGTRAPSAGRWMASWFGVRGVGSIYYLAYASTHGLAGPALLAAERAVLATIALSIVLHGASVTPLMRARRAAARPA